MFDNLSLKQKRIVGIVLIIFIIGIVYYIYNNVFKTESLEVEESIMIQNNNTSVNTSVSDKPANKIVIHITGAVKTPGIVKLNEGDRIEDAINAAGGLTEEADISKVNLAYVLEDGIKLIIPSSYDFEVEENDIISSDSGKDVIVNETTSSTNNMVNINKASEIEIETLPGIGPSLAMKIVSYREENGKFNTIEDIKNVSGIGENKYENIKNYICVK